MADLKRQWRDVIGYEGLYQVSSDGEVFSYRRKREMKLQPSRGGYLKIGLRHDGGKQLMFMVHRLVLAAFAGDCPDGHEAMHINGDPSDNRIENLRWGTHSENCLHKRSHGTAQRGQNNAKSKIRETDVPVIRDMISDGRSLAEIARAYGVRWQTIQALRDGVTWRHV